MAFQYGSQGLDIRNPFRVEGIVYAVRGAITAALGIVLLLSLRNGMPADDLARALVFVKLVGGAFLLGAGLWAFGFGLFKALRFYVGRGAPSDLTRTIPAADLADMLKRRTNPMFLEPEGLLARAVHGVFPRLLFMPLPVRAVTVQLFATLYYTLLILLLLGLAIFSGSIGLTPVTGEAFVSWLSLFAALAVLVLWLRSFPRRGGWQRRSKAPSAGIGGTVFLIIGAVLLPTLLALVPDIERLPPPPVSGGAWLFWLSWGALLVTATGILLVLLRMQAAQWSTEVSEYRQHWTESVHPMDVFRAFDMVMADHRYLEIPNRQYIAADARLNMQGSADKGDFRGEELVEIQPQPAVLKLPPLYNGLRLGVAIAAQLAMLVGALWLYAGISGLTGFGVADFSGAVAAPLVFWFFGGLAARVANLYLAEVPFVSHMLHFFADGTYSESKVSTGMAITDSTRSENVLVRSSLTPWIFLSRMFTTTFAVSGAQNLEQIRFVLDMRKDDAFLAQIVDELRRYIDSRQVIADVRSGGDLESAGGIHRLNAASRANARGEIGFRPEEREQPREIGLDDGGDGGDLRNRE